MLGTKWPSITSTWTTPAPPRSAAAISSPRRAKSADEDGRGEDHGAALAHVEADRRLRASRGSPAAASGAGRRPAPRRGRCGSARRSPSGRPRAARSRTASARPADEVGHHEIAVAGPAADQQRRAFRGERVRLARRAGCCMRIVPSSAASFTSRIRPTVTCACSRVRRPERRLSPSTAGTDQPPRPQAHPDPDAALAS